MSQAYRLARARVYIDGAEFTGLSSGVQLPTLIAHDPSESGGWATLTADQIVCGVRDRIEGLGQIDQEAWDRWVLGDLLDLEPRGLLPEAPRDPVKMPAPDRDAPPVNRQQRRAAERQARKAATRPGPNPRPSYFTQRDR